MQIAVRAGGLSAIIVVGMAVIGVAILYATFYVFLGVDSPGSMKVTDCKSDENCYTSCRYSPGCSIVLVLFDYDNCIALIIAD